MMNAENEIGGKNFIFLIQIVFVIFIVLGLNSISTKENKYDSFKDCIYVEIDGKVFCFERKEDFENILKKPCKYEGDIFSGLSVRMEKNDNDCKIIKGRMEGIKLLTLGLKIEINSAPKQDLLSIKGIGEKLAEKIIEERRRVGKFREIKELLKVKGIGEKTLKKISGGIMVDGQ